MKGWRTLLFAAIVAVLGAVETFDWATVIPQQFVGIALMAIGILVGYLRKITNTALGENE